MRDYRLETSFDVKFTTRRFTTGAPFALASGAISAYPDNSTTQLTAGITLTADFDSVTGLNNVRVVATAANGYAAGSNYSLVITTGTVDSVSVVGEVVGEFSLEAQSPLMPTVVGRKLDVSAGGEAGIDWANVGSPTTALNLSATNIDVDQVVASVSGAVGSVTGAVGSVTGAVGSVTAMVTANAIQLSGDATAADNAEAFFDGTGYAGTNNVIPLVTTTTTATNLTNAPTAGDLTATMKTSVTTAATAATPTAAAVTGNVGGNVTGTIGGLTAGALKDFFDTDSATTYASAVTGSVVKEIVTNVASGSGLDAAGVRAAVGLASANLDTQIAAVQADTDNIQTRIPAALGANGNIKADVRDLIGTAWLAPGTAGTPDVNVKLWNALTTVELPLVPTTAGRKLDVSAGGEAGVDWANIGSPTTAVNLSGTNIDVDQIVASVSGAVGSVTGAVGSVTGAVGSVTGNVGGNVVGTVASVVGAVGSVTGNVGGNVTGSVGSVVGAVGSVTGAVGSVTGNVGGNVVGTVASVVGAVGSVTGNVTGSVGSLGATAKSDVNAEVLDVLNVDTFAEPGQEAPGATVSLAKKISYLYKFLRNKVTQTSTTLKVFADDATTVDQKSTVSDDGTTYTRGEIGTGP